MARPGSILKDFPMQSERGT